MRNTFNAGLFAFVSCASACSGRLFPLSSVDGGTYDGAGAGGTAGMTGSAGSGGEGGGTGSGGAAGTGTGPGGSGGEGGVGGTGQGGAAGAAGTTVIDAGVPPPDACRALQQAQPVPVDLLIIADRSQTMHCPLYTDCDYDAGPRPAESSRWTALRDSIIEFSLEPTRIAGPGIMLGVAPLFANGDPNTLLCGASDYAIPLIGEPASNPMDISSALRAQTVGGSAVFTPVLQGALRHAATYANRHRDRQIAVAIFADPPAIGPCPSENLAAAVDAASLHFQAASLPRIRTSVIGMGIGTAAGLDTLHAVAAAGGTHQANLIDTSEKDDVHQRLGNALYLAAFPCDYALPTEVPGFDLSRISIAFRNRPSRQIPPLPPPHEWTLVERVSGPSDCGRALWGWFYDDPATPSRASLCPATCSMLGSLAPHEISFFVGCGGTVPPPNSK